VSKGCVRIQGAGYGVILCYDAMQLHAVVHKLTYRDKFSQDAIAYAIDLQIHNPEMEQMIVIRITPDNKNA